MDLYLNIQLLTFLKSPTLSAMMEQPCRSRDEEEAIELQALSKRISCTDAAPPASNFLQLCEHFTAFAKEVCDSMQGLQSGWPTDGGSLVTGHAKMRESVLSFVAKATSVSKARSTLADPMAVVTQWVETRQVGTGDIGNTCLEMALNLQHVGHSLHEAASFEGASSAGFAEQPVVFFATDVCEWSVDDLASHALATQYFRKLTALPVVKRLMEMIAAAEKHVMRAFWESTHVDCIKLGNLDEPTKGVLKDMRNLLDASRKKR